ncbi:HPP family protein [Pseudomonas schmalbachii]|uniref:HPP family protein n=1 Tax=Pseudomonas schmalbachii TaxID=2816993 RepID=A0ABS3TVH5_9PSED|nr:HPP family protein [Pseudomonas schmalbachii]MBO3277672.1 HPP family protein [Pseudomonas schmalbachii]
MSTPTHFDWLKRLSSGAAPASPREWLRILVCGCLALGGSLWLCSALFDSDAIQRIGPPLAASALLVFAVASSPLAQPWPLLAGNLLAAAIGLGAGQWLGHGWPAATAAMGSSMLAMFALRCLHPPSSALAFSLALGGPLVEQQGLLLLYPILVVSLALIGAALLLNNLTRHAYPRQLAIAPVNPHRTRDPLPSRRLDFNRADLDLALKEFGGFVDITREDLEQLLRTTELHAAERVMGGVTAADIMSRDLRTVSPHARLSQARQLFRRFHVKALPVLDERRALVGILTQSDLLAGLLGRSPFSRLALGGPSVAQVMTRQVETASLDTPLLQLVGRMSDEGRHCLPVLDERGELAGLVSQTDLIAALQRCWLQSSAVERPALQAVS